MEAKDFLEARFETAMEIKDIRSFHSFEPISPGEIAKKSFSLSEKSYFSLRAHLRKIPDWKELEIGQFFTVRDSGKTTWCVALITNTVEKLVERNGEPVARVERRARGPSGLTLTSSSVLPVSHTARGRVSAKKSAKDNISENVIL